MAHRARGVGFDVILSEATDLCSGTEILRCAQDNNPKKVRAQDDTL
jgi:hypothetical protein